MIMIRRNNKSQGQALVEFALILTVLLAMMFIIVESARILQGWVTVQNAARAGARYAITGNFTEGWSNVTDCEAVMPAKFDDRCDDFRVASIIEAAHEGLSGLPLDEDPASDPFSNPPDENSYYIEVYGGIVGEDGAYILDDFAGMPGQVVVVRAVYNVPVITPFFRPIIDVIPVFGQVTMNNEAFGSLGNPTSGAGLPPDFGSPLPTVGASPTPVTPTPTETPDPALIPTETPTPTETFTPTPTYCGAYIESPPVDGQNYLWVSGEPGADVTVIDLTTGETLGQDTFVAVGGHLCGGFADFSGADALNPVLVAGHVILAVPSQGQPANAIVLQGSPTPTATNTPVVLPTSTQTATPTVTPTSTPSDPYIRLIANCSISTDAQFNVLGYNWPTDESIALFWNGAPQSVIPAGHSGSFSQNWTKSGLIVGTQVDPTIYEVRATSNTWTKTANFRVPCDYEDIPTPEATVTPTPAPADLIVVGPPQILSTRPLVAYQPISVRVAISNTGDVDVSSQFFVDVYFDPQGSITPTINITNSVGYMGVSALAGGASRVITITAPIGFENEPDPHLVYAMVDSLLQVSEADETNNVSESLTVGDVTPAATPTQTATPPVGGEFISGVARLRIISWLPQPRAVITLVDEGTGEAIISTVADQNGFFEFPGIPAGTYTVRACTILDNNSYSGLRVGITASSSSADVYLLAGPCS